MNSHPRKQVYFTVGFYETEMEIIHRTVTDLGINRLAAIRLLIRRGANATATSPFTPEEVQHDRAQ